MAQAGVEELDRMRANPALSGLYALTSLDTSSRLRTKLNVRNAAVAAIEELDRHIAVMKAKGSTVEAAEQLKAVLVRVSLQGANDLSTKVVGTMTNDLTFTLKRGLEAATIKPASNAVSEPDLSIREQESQQQDHAHLQDLDDEDDDGASSGGDSEPPEPFLRVLGPSAFFQRCRCGQRSLQTYHRAAGLREGHWL